ncbi:MAG TPA: hypothetical protein VGV89_10430 [Thermoplasmata archaeon]|nr:hypothetical protein [Thermoplasmata archaeon]
MEDARAWFAILFSILLSATGVLVAAVAYSNDQIGGPAGPPGSQGLPGANGTPGRNGHNGTQGPAGPRGAQGPAGLNGRDGLNGTNGINGSQGPSGRNGTNGKQGPPGQNGPNYTYANLVLTFQLCGKPFAFCAPVYNVTLYVWGPCSDLGRGIWICNVSLNVSYSPTMHSYSFRSVDCNGTTAFYFAASDPSLPYSILPSGSQPFTLWFQVVQTSGTISATVQLDVVRV